MKLTPTLIRLVGIAAVALLQACATPSINQNAAQSCALSGSKNFDLLQAEAIGKLETGCAAQNTLSYFDALMDLAKDSPSVEDAPVKINAVLERSVALGGITEKTHTDTFVRYFSPQFVTANRANTIYTLGCTNAQLQQFGQAMDSEMRAKSVGIRKIMRDEASYNKAFDLYNSLLNAVEASCIAAS